LTPTSVSPALFEPTPHTLYTLDHVSQLLALSRHWIALCARYGLIHPLVKGWYFDPAAIQTLRRIEHMGAVHGLDLLGIKLDSDLTRELEALRAEVRFRPAR
jgi:hypothetical protein